MAKKKACKKSCSKKSCSQKSCESKQPQKIVVDKNTKAGIFFQMIKKVFGYE